MIGNVDRSSGFSLPLLIGLFSSFFILDKPRLARGGNDRLSGGSELARATPLPGKELKDAEVLQMSDNGNIEEQRMSVIACSIRN